MKPILALAAAASLIAGAAAAEPLKAGDKAPDFTLTSTTGGKHAAYRLQDQLKKGKVVLYFYPAAFTGGCTIEARMFTEALPDFAKKGATVIGVSLDPIATLDQFSTKECQGKLTLGADASGKVADLYGVKTTMSPPGGAPRTIASRTTFVIGQDGRIALSHTAQQPNEHISRSLAAVGG